MSRRTWKHWLGVLHQEHLTEVTMGYVEDEEGDHYTAHADLYSVTVEARTPTGALRRLWEAVARHQQGTDAHE